ncbi:hypothetical protein HDU98_011407, partial [Podochytrium sp. JEL0797]
MGQIVVTATGIEIGDRDRIKTLCEVIGAEFSPSLTSSTTHLIANGPGSQKYTVASSLKKPIVRASWIDACAALHSSLRRRLGVKDVAKITNDHRFRALDGLAICLTGFDLDRRNIIEAQVTSLGARFAPDLTKDCSHLVAVSTAGKKYEFAVRHGLCIVDAEWVTEVPEADYPVGCARAEKTSFRIPPAEVQPSAPPTFEPIQQPRTSTVALPKPIPSAPIATYSTNQNTTPVMPNPSTAARNRLQQQIAKTSETPDASPSVLQPRKSMAPPPLPQTTSIHHTLPKPRKSIVPQQQQQQQEPHRNSLAPPPNSTRKSASRKSLSLAPQNGTPKQKPARKSGGGTKRKSMISQHIQNLRASNAAANNTFNSVSTNGLGTLTTLFAGLSFLILGFDASDTEILGDVIECNQGDVVHSSDALRDRVRSGGKGCAVVPLGVGPEDADVAGLVVVSECWVERCVEDGCVHDFDAHVLFRGVRYLDTDERFVVGITGYEGLDREQIRKLVQAMGGSFTESLSKKNTHLIAHTELDADGTPMQPSMKVVRAREWGIEIAAVDWLFGCAAEGVGRLVWPLEVQEDPIAVDEGGDEVEEMDQGFEHEELGDVTVVTEVRGGSATSSVKENVAEVEVPRALPQPHSPSKAQPSVPSWLKSLQKGNSSTTESERQSESIQAPSNHQQQPQTPSVPQNQQTTPVYPKSTKRMQHPHPSQHPTTPVVLPAKLETTPVLPKPVARLIEETAATPKPFAFQMPESSPLPPPPPRRPTPREPTLDDVVTQESPQLISARTSTSATLPGRRPDALPTPTTRVARPTAAPELPRTVSVAMQESISDVHSTNGVNVSAGGGESIRDSSVEKHTQPPPPAVATPIQSQTPVPVSKPRSPQLQKWSVAVPPPPQRVGKPVFDLADAFEAVQSPKGQAVPTKPTTTTTHHHNPSPSPTSLETMFTTSLTKAHQNLQPLAAAPQLPLHNAHICLSNRAISFRHTAIQICKSLGATFLNTYTDACTHYIHTPGGGVGAVGDGKEWKRVKADAAVGRCWIVSPAWLEACRERGGRVGEAEFPWTVDLEKGLKVEGGGVVVSEVVGSGDVGGVEKKRRERVEEEDVGGAADSYVAAVDQLISISPHPMKRSSWSKARRPTSQPQKSPPEPTHQPTTTTTTHPHHDHLLPSDVLNEYEEGTFTQAPPEHLSPKRMDPYASVVIYDDPQARVAKRRLMQQFEESAPSVTVAAERDSKKTKLGDDDDAAASLFNASNVSTRASYTRVFLITGIPNSRRKQLTQRIQNLGGKVVAPKPGDAAGGGWCNECTHLVCGKPVNTEKCYAAIAKGAWLMKEEYIEKSFGEGKFLEEEDYEWAVEVTSGNSMSSTRSKQHSIADKIALSAKR